MEIFIVEFRIGNKRMRGRVQALHYAHAVQKVRDQLVITSVTPVAEPPEPKEPKTGHGASRTKAAMDDVFKLFGDLHTTP